MSLFIALISQANALTFAVLPLKSDNKAESQIIENQIKGAMIEGHQHRVLTDSELESHLRLIGGEPCADRACALKIGDHLGVDFIAYGKYKNEWLQLEIIDVEAKKRILNRPLNLDQKRYQRVYDESKAAISKAEKEKPSIHYASQFYQQYGYNGTYVFDAYPSDVMVYVNGSRVCDSVPCSVALEEGAHSALFLKPGYDSELWYFHTSQKFSPRLEGTPTTVSLKKVDKSVEIWLDGEKVERNAADQYVVEPGTHSFTFLSECYKNETIELSLDTREQRILEPQLKPLKKQIFIPTNGERQLVFVDNEFVGYTNEHLFVPTCSELLRFDGVYHPLERYIYKGNQ